jgi:NhaP-type Na+/H+ and K+/H+ antiporter
MEGINVYLLVIYASLVIVISYFFNIISKKTGVPSVLMLILLGIGIHEILIWKGMPIDKSWFSMLELLGIVGLILIVLEAALELKLSREKKGVILQSISSALLGLLLTTAAIAALLHYTLIPDWFQAVLYATPLGVMSSAIVIPSVGGLSKSNQEFMIYESTFSDIFGIVLFFSITGNAEASSAWSIVKNVAANIGLTVVLAVVLAVVLVWLLQKITTKVKLFLLIAILLILYSAGKLMHLSPLFIILFFGLALSNYKLLAVGKARKLFNEQALHRVLEEMHTITLETAFVVRTFFFVVLGITFDIRELLDMQALYISLGVLALIYLTRLVTLKVSMVKSLFPLVWLAPRGLITIMLVISVPAQYRTEFPDSILLYVILISCLIMMGGLMSSKRDEEDVPTLTLKDIETLDKELESFLAQHNCQEKPGNKA